MVFLGSPAGLARKSPHVTEVLPLLHLHDCRAVTQSGVGAVHGLGAGLIA